MSKNNPTKHCIILVPGLGDRLIRHWWLTKKWETDSIDIFMHPVPWNKEESFQIKLTRLIKHIDQLYSKGYKVSLVGTSAGGSLVINAFTKRTSKIHRVISVCGRVRKGNHVFPSLELAAKGFPAFAKSVIVCEKELPQLSRNNLKKIMTVRCSLFDGVVPMSCVQIEGATNVAVPMFFHMFGIAVALTLWRRKIIRFITNS